jgi:predicted membrane chloride channel (bestrophin family)
VQLTWLLLLPLGIWDSCHWLSIPAEAFIALFLLGIEDIGVQIEEPFSILSCEAICGSVKGNTASIMEMQVTLLHIIIVAVIDC